MPTNHALVLDNESGGIGPGCSRCGATSRDDLANPCPAVSDGEIYTGGQRLSMDELRKFLGQDLFNK